MKPSEIFEGENSSLKKTFDEAAKKHTPDIVEEMVQVTPMHYAQSRALPKQIVITLPDFEKAVTTAHQQGFKDGEKAERERIIKEYGWMDNGCGCCSDATLKESLEKEALKDK